MIYICLNPSRNPVNIVNTQIVGQFDVNGSVVLIRPVVEQRDIVCTEDRFLLANDTLQLLRGLCVLPLSDNIVQLGIGLLRITFSPLQHQSRSLRDTSRTRLFHAR